MIAMELGQLLDVEWAKRFLQSIVEIVPLDSGLFVTDLDGNVLVAAGPTGMPDEVVGHLRLTAQTDIAGHDAVSAPRAQVIAPINIHGQRVGYVIGVPLDPEQMTAQVVASATQLISQVLADQAYKEYELNSMTAELLNKYEEITLLYDLSQALGSVFDIPTVCDIALEKALQAVTAAKAFVMLVDKDSKHLTAVAARGIDGFVGWKMPVGQGISGRVAASGKQILLLEGEPSPLDVTEERASLNAVLAVPLILSTGQGRGENEGEVVGVMTMVGKPPGEMFTAGDAKLLTTIATQVATAIYNSRLVQALRETERVRKEMEIAARIQQSLLPDSPPQLATLELAGQCIPATNVGGDYYDFLTDEAGRLSLLIADVSGHSVGAALMMAMARSILRREISQGESPATVLANTNTAMLHDLTNAELFITVFCARYDLATRRLTFANGGHNLPLLRHAADGQILRLDGDGMIIGILDDVEYEERSTVLHPGDVVVLYTDGVIEARSPDGEQFGEGRLRGLLAEYGLLSPSALADRIYEAVRQHSRDTDQQDDITLLILKVQEE